MKTLEKINQVLLSPRFKSFYWRNAMMFLAGLLTLLTNSITELGLPVGFAVVLGLFFGEVSKHITNKIKERERLEELEM